MKPLELTSEELEVLVQLLKSSQARLEIEILHTDHSEFKCMLKDRRDLVAGILGRLSAYAEPRPVQA